MRILISILTYNGKEEKLCRTITDAYKQKVEGIAVNIVLIDNCSTNNITERIKKSFPSLHIMQTEQNLGFGGGNNLAIDLAKSLDVDLLFIFNDDLLLPSNYIKTITHYAPYLQNAGIIGTTIRFTNGQIQAVGGKLMWQRVLLLYSTKKLNSNENRIYKVDGIQGCAFALTRNALEAGVHLDERLFFGGEEYDLAYWAKSKGLKTYVIEDLEVIHDTNQAKHILNPYRFPPSWNYCYFATRSRMFIHVKYNFPSFRYFWGLFYLVGECIAKSFIYFLFGRIDIFSAYAYGILDGAIGRMGPTKIVAGLR